MPKIIFDLVGISLTGFAAYDAWSGGAGYWGILAAATLTLFIGSIDRIRKFKLSQEGIEAETRELVRETKGTLDELRYLAAIVAKSTLSLAIRSGRFGGYSDQDMEMLRHEIAQTLRHLGLPNDKIEEAEQDLYLFTEYDYALFITGGHQIPADLPRDKIGAWEALRNHGVAGRPSPDQLKTTLRDLGILTTERSELIEDYRFYIKYRRHRRPDVWASRNQ